MGKSLKKMVDNATGDDDAAPADFVSTQELWEDGTRVTFAEDGVWYMGTITGFSKNEYKIKWDDGVFEIEDDLDLVNQMVADVVTNSPSGKQKNQEYLKSMVKAARYIPDDEDVIIDGPARIGMSAAGKAFLNLFYRVFQTYYISYTTLYTLHYTLL